MRPVRYRRRRGLGDAAPNFVELNNNPDQSSAFATNYADPPSPWLTTAPEPSSTITFGPTTIKPATSSAKASTAAAAPKASTGKVAVRRKGTAGAILDKILPLMVDAAGKQTIFGLPPALVYVAGGILSASLLAFVLRLLRGGVGRVSNPKRARTSRRPK